MTKGMQAINNERESQFTRGYDAVNDANYKNGELLHAAEAHLIWGTGDGDALEAQDVWPFAPIYLHLNTPTSSLAKAGALIAAEIDRRFAAGECTESDFAFMFDKE